MKKKILMYNWIPFDETEGKGGGVTVYTKSLINYLTAYTDWEIYFLSSGRAYDRRRKHVFIEQTSNIFGNACKSYQIVNSPVLSPAHLGFACLEDMLHDRSLKKTVGDFIAENGGFHVIHFQNFEGLSLSVLELKREYPQTRFLYSLHNYYPFCPQVMLWKADKENCREGRCGEACISCMPGDVHKRKVIYNQQINYDRWAGRPVSPLRKTQQYLLENAYRIHDRYRKGKKSARARRKLAGYFNQFGKDMVWHLNHYTDAILAVSSRVAGIAVAHGIWQEKVSVSYIGTEMASRQKGHGSYPYKGGIFYLCYLGYMRRMKGFYFLLDALERMPAELAGRTGIKLAVSIPDKKVRKRLENLEKKFAEIICYPGYTHEQLPEIFEQVQLGIVPSLWEDNLPQVAMEMKAQGIPVLTSNLGGTKELTRSGMFVFPAGNQEAFLEKIDFFVKNPQYLEEYWRDAPGLTSMQEHVKELEAFYFG